MTLLSFILLLCSGNLPLRRAEKWGVKSAVIPYSDKTLYSFSMFYASVVNISFSFGTMRISSSFVKRSKLCTLTKADRFLIHEWLLMPLIDKKLIFNPGL